MSGEFNAISGRAKKTFGAPVTVEEPAPPVQAGSMLDKLAMSGMEDQGASEAQTFTSAYPGEQTFPVMEHKESAPTDLGFSSTDNVEPCFTVLQMETSAVSPYSREYTERLNITNCVAEIPMLLDYMVRLERAFGVTLPFKACGIDTIVFNTVATQEDGGPYMVSVEIPNQDKVPAHPAFYEKIQVDDVIYLSCLNESLNPDYLHRIIMEAVDAVYMHGRYVYTLIGPRPLNGRTVTVDVETGDLYVPQVAEPTKGAEEATKTGEAADATTSAPSGVAERQEFITTMKLNSYELSVFINYMKSISGVNIKYGTYDGRQAILFSR